MTHPENDTATPSAKQQAAVAPLMGLFDEMQALMILLPGTIADRGKPLPTDEEVEDMFDNMPL